MPADMRVKYCRIVSCMLYAAADIVLYHTLLTCPIASNMAEGHAVLCRANLCCANICCVVLCRATLVCAVLC